jgi:hypothetical protein
MAHLCVPFLFPRCSQGGADGGGRGRHKRHDGGQPAANLSSRYVTMPRLYQLIRITRLITLQHCGFSFACCVMI